MASSVKSMRDSMTDFSLLTINRLQPIGDFCEVKRRVWKWSAEFGCHMSDIGKQTHFYPRQGSLVRENLLLKCLTMKKNSANNDKLTFSDPCMIAS